MLTGESVAMSEDIPLTIDRQPPVNILPIDSYQLDKLGTGAGTDTCLNIEPQELFEINCELKLNSQLFVDKQKKVNIDFYIMCTLDIDQFNCSLFTHTLKCVNYKTRMNTNIILSSVENLLTEKNAYLFEIDQRTMKSRIEGLFMVKIYDLELNEIMEQNILQKGKFKEEKVPIDNFYSLAGSCFVMIL